MQSQRFQSNKVLYVVNANNLKNKIVHADKVQKINELLYFGVLNKEFVCIL